MSSKEVEEENLSSSLVESVGSRGLEIAGEIAELALDSGLEEGLLQKIPVFGLLFKAYGVTQTIRDRLFLKKVALFLYGASSASVEDREKFRDDLNNDPKSKKKVGENLILLIDNHERFEKSYYLGKLMAKVVEGKCSTNLFLRLASAIDRASVEDLQALKGYWNHLEDMPDEFQQGLYKSGLLDIKIEAFSIEPIVSVQITYEISPIGEMLIKYLFVDIPT